MKKLAELLPENASLVDETEILVKLKDSITNISDRAAAAPVSSIVGFVNVFRDRYMLDSNTVRQTFKYVTRFPPPSTAALCHSNLEKALMIISYIEAHSLTSKIEEYMIRRLEDKCIMADRQAEYAAQRTAALIAALNLEANDNQRYHAL